MVSFCDLQDLFDEGDNCGFEGFVVKAVLTVKALGVAVVLLEQVVAVDSGIVCAEKTVGVLAVKIGDAFELLTFHHVEVFDDLARYLKGLGAVLASVLERICGIGLQNL